MRTKELQDILKKEWDLNLLEEDIDLDMTLIELSESIACETENATLESVYEMFIGHQDLHLPGCIAFTIVTDMGLDPRKFTIHNTLRDILDTKTQ